METKLETASSFLTVKELALELGVTPQGVNKFLRVSGLGARVVKNGNRSMIPPELAIEIRNHFQKPSETETKIRNENPSVSNSKSDREPSPEARPSEGSSADAAIQALVEQLAILQKQLEVKDLQIETLTMALASATEANKALSATNAVQVVSDKKELLLEPQDKPRKGFFARLLGM